MVKTGTKVFVLFVVMLFLSCAKNYNYFHVESIYENDIYKRESKLFVEKIYDQQQKINALKDLQNTMLPIDYSEEELNLINTAFFNDLFDILQHLHIQDSFNIDFLRYGAPRFYCYQEESFSNYEEYEHNLKFNNISDNDNPYLNNILIEDSEEGYFEFVILEKIGEQFLLFGHANYNDVIIIADSTEIDYIEYSINILAQNRRTHESGYTYLDTTNINHRTLNDGRFFPSSRKISLNDNDKEELYNLSVPSIRFYSSYVAVEFLSFTKWGGFMKEVYYIKRSFPHKIMRKVEQQIVEYNIGVRF